LGIENPARLQRTSLSGAVYDELKRRIITVELTPGAQLVPEELAPRLGVSRTPIREALSLLARDRLVQVAPNGTTWVARPSIDYLSALLDVRQVLEGKAAAGAAGNIPKERLHALQDRCAAAYTRLRRTGDARPVAEVDEELHQLVLRACGNEVLIQVLAPLADYSGWLRQLGLRQGERVGGNLEEHRAILRALAAGDRDQARAAMEAHIEAAKHRQLAIVAAMHTPAVTRETAAGAALTAQP